jgi:parallel beta-helix repeat protein
VRIHGVTVEKYSSPAQRGAIEGKDGSNWTVDGCTVRLNSGAGVAVGHGGRITGSDIYRNGQIGAVMVGRDLMLQGNVIWENNRLGFDFTWEAGGVKIAASENVIVERNFVYRNDGPGLWCDIDCRNVVFKNNRVEYNSDVGIFHEISYRAVIRDNVVRFNGQARRPWYWGADILIAASENVDVYRNNVTTRDGGAGIMLIDQGRTKPDGQTYRTSGNFVHNNIVEFMGDGFMGGASDTAETHPNFSIIETGSNQFDNNVYKVKHQSHVIFVWGHKTQDWTEFRQIGQEPRGRFQFID